MSEYSIDDIKIILQKYIDLLKPYYLFCNPSDENELKKIVEDENFPIQKVISSEVVEQGKTYLIKRADLIINNSLNIDNKGGEK